MIVAVIPARSGSKGIVDKNIQDLGGKPLLAWTIEACIRCPTINRVIVSTDSNTYADIARQYSADVPFLRPASISGDRSSDLEFIEHLLDYLDNEEKLPEYVLHMRPTTPFRKICLIEKAIEIFQASPQATSCRSMHKMSESAFKSLILNDAGYADSILNSGSQIGLEASNQARQSFPDTYSANGYVDIIKPSVVKQTHALYGKSCMPFITEPTIEIDEPSDLDMARKLFQVGYVNDCIDC